MFILKILIRVKEYKKIYISIKIIYRLIKKLRARIFRYFSANRQKVIRKFQQM